MHIKIFLINENNFQVWSYYNRQVWPTHQVISSTGSLIYYTINQKWIDGTSVMKLRLEIMITVCPVKKLTHSVCFNHWSLKKWTQTIRHKIANKKCLLYSHVKIHLVKYLTNTFWLNHCSFSDCTPNLFYKIANTRC